MAGRHRRGGRRETAGGTDTKVVAVIAAHNEEACIAATLEALAVQTRPPDAIYVFTDNCTDQTAEVAARHGVAVTCTVGNADRKAGVLNRATALLLPALGDSDVVMGFDADSVPQPDFVANALGCVARGYGAVGATFHARPGGGFLGQLQRSEFARFARHQHRRARCDVLSGTGWAIPAGVLRAVAARRPDGQVWDVRHIVEDFELTLALLDMGVQAVSPASCRVTTDVMTTVPAWVTQRLRWQHGTLVALRHYGWTRVTRAMIVRQVLTYLVMLATPLAAGYLAWSFALFGWAGVNPANAPLYAAGIGIVVLEQAWQARAAGKWAVLMSLLVVPDFLYSLARQVVYLRALSRLARGKNSTAWGAGTAL